jgi:hypothetical protein
MDEALDAYTVRATPLGFGRVVVLQRKLPNMLANPL